MFLQSIRGQNIKFIPIFLLLTSHFMYWLYQGFKKVSVGELCGRGGGGGASRVVVANGLVSMPHFLGLYVIFIVLYDP